MKRIGKIIKRWATALAIIGFVIIAAGFAVIGLLSHSDIDERVTFAVGVAIMGVGVAVSWLSVFQLHAVGEQLEQTTTITRSTPKQPIVTSVESTDTVRIESPNGMFSIAIPVELQPYIHTMESIEFPNMVDSLSLISTVFEDGYMMTPIYTFYVLQTVHTADFEERWHKKGITLTPNGAVRTKRAVKISEGFSLTTCHSGTRYTVYCEYFDNSRLDRTADGYDETYRALEQHTDIIHSFRWETTV